MSEIIYLSNVVLSFPHLVEPHASTLNPNAPKKYSADFIMPMDHPGLKQFMQQYATMAATKWGDNANAVMQMIQSDRKLRCFGMGAEKVDKKTFQPYKGYANNAFIAANKDQAPQMIRADGSAIEAGNAMEYRALARKMYGGCFVNAAVRPWLQENSFGRGVRCDLVAIQFSKDGEAFGEAQADAAPMFGAVATDPAAPSFDMPGFMGQ